MWSTPYHAAFSGLFLHRTSPDHLVTERGMVEERRPTLFTQGIRKGGSGSFPTYHTRAAQRRGGKEPSKAAPGGSGSWYITEKVKTKTWKCTTITYPRG